MKETGVSSRYHSQATYEDSFLLAKDKDDGNRRPLLGETEGILSTMT